MNATSRLGSHAARDRLLALLGIEVYVLRQRLGGPSNAKPPLEVEPVVVVDRADTIDHPLLRAILEAAELDASRIRVASGTPPVTPILIAFGPCQAHAALAAPSLPDLARNPAAKRDLWRRLRRLRAR